MDILSRYTYHCSVRTLAGANGIEDNHSGYWRDVYLDHGDDRVDFNCGGTVRYHRRSCLGRRLLGRQRAAYHDGIEDKRALVSISVAQNRLDVWTGLCRTDSQEAAGKGGY